MRSTLIRLAAIVFFLAAAYFFAWPLSRGKAVDPRLLPLLDKPSAPVPAVMSAPLPALEAGSFIVVDDLTNLVLLSQNEDTKIYPASITKLATALTALNIYPLEEIVTVGDKYTEGKVMGLEVGEKISVKSLVTALLIFSANDAAIALAGHHQRGIPGFVEEMNTLSKKFLLSSTNFTNVDGIHSPVHYSTVADLAQLGRVSVRNPFVVDTVKKTSDTVTDISGLISHPLIATNELLAKTQEIEGLKTGWTPEAGGCFIGLFNLSGHYLISVVAQSPDRFADTLKLLDWAKANVTWPLSSQ